MVFFHVSRDRKDPLIIYDILIAYYFSFTICFDCGNLIKENRKYGQHNASLMFGSKTKTRMLQTKSVNQLKYIEMYLHLNVPNVYRRCSMNYKYGPKEVHNEAQLCCYLLINIFSMTSEKIPHKQESKV